MGRVFLLRHCAMPRATLSTHSLTHAHPEKLLVGFSAKGTGRSTGRPGAWSPGAAPPPAGTARLRVGAGFPVAGSRVPRVSHTHVLLLLLLLYYYYYVRQTHEHRVSRGRNKIRMTEGSLGQSGDGRSGRRVVLASASLSTEARKSPGFTSICRPSARAAAAGGRQKKHE